MKRWARGAATLVAVVGFGVTVFGCAAADKPGHCGGGACDLGVGVGGNGGDFAEPPLPTYDMANLLGFGESCTDNTQCESNICIYSGTGGVCTRVCNNDCPPGYGCYGVDGAIEPGQITYVCVPENNQLCTPCTRDTECSTGGHDLCLASPVGGHFCARDCSKINCPNGFTCEDVAVGDMGTFKQCVPANGSCDCDASKTGMTVSCEISTPFGTCAGTRTCMGAGGWSSKCDPPSASDTPDDQYKDDNCDGIDGDVTKGVFVATAQAGAADSPTCGTLTEPCKTINYGINQAAAAALRYVYVQAGVYNETVLLFNGIDVVGGYDATWTRAPRSTAGHDVQIVGGWNAGESQFMTVQAHGLAANTTLWDLDIVGPNVDALHPGLSSYAVHAVNAKLTLKRVGIYAGNGADGKPGSNGSSAGTLTATSGMNGAVAPPSPPGPGNADEHVTSCDKSGRGRGGDPGTNACPDDDNPNGGGGGAGGTMDTSCTCVFGACACTGSGCNATAGLGGGAAAVSSGSYGYGGGGGAGGDGSSLGGNPGGPGRVQNGAGGASDARRGGFLAANYWYAFAGKAGTVGKNGGGGGGGGGSGGDDAGTDSWGAGGGGGGAGGCRAKSGGGGGGGGGGSFGIFAVSSTVDAQDCAVQMGNGGAGGSGGRGGTGQNGGAGAPAGLASGDSKAGGPGGSGGHGGHSGGGGGGNGGVVYGIYSYSSTVSQSCSFNGGSAGAAGPGGAAAAPAPGGPNDGAAGANGAAGLIGGVGTCANASGC